MQNVHIFKNEKKIFYAESQAPAQTYRVITCISTSSLETFLHISIWGAEDLRISLIIVNFLEVNYYL